MTQVSVSSSEMTSSEAVREAFVQWISTHGGYKHPDLNLFETKDGSQERGVFARASIPKGEQLLLIPQALTLFLSEGPQAPCTASQQHIPIVRMHR